MKTLQKEPTREVLQSILRSVMLPADLSADAIYSAVYHALPEVEQKPVAFARVVGAPIILNADHLDDEDIAEIKDHPNYENLYTHPAPLRELTDGEIFRIWCSEVGAMRANECLYGFARAILAKARSN
ncbi:hypothetical protein F6R98_10270 [Candidatus Methylospira mobilis]|uniref:Uncharacterized protein n=1 Tax=Candidatus Methylospira mobilis TaxID=1808979 RepID=A0A5Q0BHD0_9GAMM|nr:hypothetical protein [Candidatus Methylospira mobilis]QFY42949.1 hypothetical protein F6R98_10270 [Candidatus Methylospira mobilis]